MTVEAYCTCFGDLGLPDLVRALSEQLEVAKQGELDRGEAMLVAQAHTLDAIFNQLARRAANSDYLEHLETYLRLGLRAQAQSRQTWEAVSIIKHPPMANYVGQANIANGPQQVNYGDSGTTEAEKLPYELLEEQHACEWLDRGTSSTAGGTDSELEAVGAVHGTEDAGR